MPRITLCTEVDGHEECLSEYICDWPDCPEVAVEIVGRARAGSVRLLGEESDGWEVERRVAETGRPTLVLDAGVGAGSVRVDRAVP